VHLIKRANGDGLKPGVQDDSGALLDVSRNARLFDESQLVPNLLDSPGESNVRLNRLRLKPVKYEGRGLLKPTHRL
jgi:hypothetical protein